MGFYNQHQADEHFHKNQFNLWRQRAMTLHQHENTRRTPPPGMSFLMNIMSLGVSQAGDLSDGREPAMVWLKC